MGELLSYLRRNKYMSLLMLCRKIVHIKIIDNIAEIKTVEQGEEIFSNETYKQILEEFFRTKNLGIKQYKKIIKKTEKTDAEILSELLGGRLEIKQKKIQINY